MSENWNNTSNRVFDLVSEGYNTMMNAWMWSTQRALEFNKVMVSQFEVSQNEGRKYVEEFNSKARQGMQLAQEMWQDNLKTYSENLSAWRSATETSVNELTNKVEELQHRMVEGTASAN
jgi:polyhydroxyalkanoate synthesis regulator phasin